MAYDHEDPGYRPDPHDPHDERDFEVIDPDDRGSRNAAPPAAPANNGSAPTRQRNQPPAYRRKSYESGGSSRDSSSDPSKRYVRKKDPRLEIIGDIGEDDLRKAVAMIHTGKLSTLMDLAEAEERRKARRGTTMKWILRLLWWAFDKMITIIFAAFIAMALIRDIPGFLPGIA